MNDLYIEAKRITSESRKIKVSVFEPTSEMNDKAIYKVVRQRISSVGTTIVKEITSPFIEDDYTIKVVGDYTVFELMDSVSKYGAEYIYRVIKEEDSNITTASLYVSVKTLPSKVQNVKILANQTEYDKNNIPTKIALGWDPIDVDDNNINTLGYAIFYSLADRGQSNWSVWKSVKGTSTTDTTSIVNIIDKSIDKVSIDVPQLTDYLNPKDIKMTVVSVTKDVPQLQSRYSNIVSFMMKDVVTTLALKNTISTIKFTPSNLATRPVTITTTDKTFDEDAVLLLSRANYDPKFGNFVERYTYNFSSNKDIKNGVTVSVEIDLFYHQRFEVRIFDVSTNKWVQVPATYNMQTKNINFSLTTITNFIILLPERSATNTDYLNEEKAKVFANYTNIIISQLPTWSKMRRNPLDSIGAHFLNVTGLEIDDMEFILNYAYEQANINTADIEQADIVYKTSLPKEILESDLVRIIADDNLLSPSASLEEFLTSTTISKLTPEINYKNKYIIDYDDLVLYVKKPYSANTTYPNGYVSISLTRGLEEEPYSVFEAKLELHHVWNFFDEFGMLFNTPRLYGEPNSEFKVRILDVFKNKSNSTRQGLSNGIARELGIRKYGVWSDTSVDFVIKDPMVMVNMIKVNDLIVPTTNIYFTSDNHIVIKKFSDDILDGAEVTYISGLEMHTFNNRNDNSFVQQLYNVDDTATDLFKHYVETIKNKIPVEWGQFKWNEGYWDIADEEMSGFGVLPTILDGNITGFKNYTTK